MNKIGNNDNVTLSSQLISDAELSTHRELYNSLSTVDRLTKHVVEMVVELHKRHPSLAGEVHPLDTSLDASVKRVAMQIKVLNVVLCSLISSTRRLCNALLLETNLSAGARKRVISNMERSIRAMTEILIEIDGLEECIWEEALEPTD